MSSPFRSKSTKYTKNPETTNVRAASSAFVFGAFAKFFRQWTGTDFSLWRGPCSLIAALADWPPDGAAAEEVLDELQEPLRVVLLLYVV